MPFLNDTELDTQILIKRELGLYYDPTNTNLLNAFSTKSELEESDTARLNGHDPISDPTGNPSYGKKPHCVYFFYTRINTNGKYYVTHYFKDFGRPLSNGDLKKIVEDMASNARPSGNNNDPRPLPDVNFQNIKIKRVSYFILFVDEEHWKFAQPNNKPKVEFLTRNPQTGDPCQPNFSFFKAHVVKAKLGADTREALCMVNLMKRDAKGTELVDGDDHAWWFDFYKSLSFELPDRLDGQGNVIVGQIDPAQERKFIVIADPGGNNLGPPDPP